MPWAAKESQAQDIMLRIAALISWVAPGVMYYFPSFRADDLDCVALLDKCPIGMDEFRRPKTYLPSCLSGYGRVGGHQQDTLRRLRVKNANSCAHILLF